MYIICMYIIYIWNVRYVTFNGRLRLEQRHEVVTSHIAVSSSYAKTGFISLSIAVYQFLVQNIGKSHTKLIAALKKLLLDSYPSCALFLLHIPQSSLSYFQNLKLPSLVLQKSNSHHFFGADTWKQSLSLAEALL